MHILCSSYTFCHQGTLLQYVAQVHRQLMMPCEFGKLCNGAQVKQQEAAALCQEVGSWLKIKTRES